VDSIEIAAAQERHAAAGAVPEGPFINRADPALEAGPDGSAGARGGAVYAGGSGSSISGRSGWPVMSREPRPWVRKLHAQRVTTTIRLANPIR